MSPLTEALEDRQRGATKDQNGEEDDDEGGGAQHLNDFFRGKLAALVYQVEGKGVRYSTTQACAC